MEDLLSSSCILLLKLRFILLYILQALLIIRAMCALLGFIEEGQLSDLKDFLSQNHVEINSTNKVMISWLLTVLSPKYSFEIYAHQYILQAHNVCPTSSVVMVLFIWLFVLEIKVH